MDYINVYANGKINIGHVSMEDIEIGMKKTSKKGKKVEYKD